MAPKKTPPAPMIAEMESFPRRLHQLMMEKGMSQSDLARAVWGSRDDPRGYKVARNRDRISSYLGGRGTPDPRNLRAIAKALGVSETDLAPDLAAARIDRESPEIQMTAIAGHSDRVLLKVHKLVPLQVAAEIVKRLADADNPS